MKTDPKAGRADALRRAMLAYVNDKSGPLNTHPGFLGPLLCDRRRFGTIKL